MERRIDGDRLPYMVKPAEAAKHTEKIAKGKNPVSFSCGRVDVLLLLLLLGAVAVLFNGADDIVGARLLRFGYVCL